MKFMNMRPRRDGGLFVDYIITFLKLKAEASGFPTCVRTPEDEESYIKDFYERECVQLDRDAIRPNAAKRGIAKLCLNSMWGKLTERNNRPKTRIISEPQELYRLLATLGIEVGTLLFCIDDFVLVSWTFTEEEQAPSLRHTNNVLGSYATAGARLRLYSYLDKLQERALYCDMTAFCMYRERTNSL
jgi:hypothetical protein